MAAIQVRYCGSDSGCSQIAGKWSDVGGDWEAEPMG